MSSEVCRFILQVCMTLQVLQKGLGTPPLGMGPLRLPQLPCMRLALGDCLTPDLACMCRPTGMARRRRLKPCETSKSRKFARSGRGHAAEAAAKSPILARMCRMTGMAGRWRLDPCADSAAGAAAVDALLELPLLARLARGARDRAGDRRERGRI